MFQIRPTFRIAVLFALLLAAAPALAQSPAGLGADGIQLSRPELESRLASYEQTAESPAYSSDMRSIASREAELIRGRLAGGDFRTGDQIALQVEGEESLTGTFTVTGDRTLDLPAIGSIPLEGVLRSELETYLTEQIGRYVRNPRVRTRALFRVTITGAVGQPGFYVVPAEALLTDALMTAGGPSGAAKLDAIRVERAGEAIWSGAELQRAITEGRTLDELSLTAGDQIIVPQRGRSLVGTALYGISAVASVTYLLMRIF